MTAGSPQRQLWEQSLITTLAANAVKAGADQLSPLSRLVFLEHQETIGLRRQLPAATAIAAKVSAIWVALYRSQ